MSRNPHSRRRRALLASILVTGAVGMHAAVAGAVLVPEDGGPGTTGSAPPVSRCTQNAPPTWPSSPRVVIHTKGLTDAPVSLTSADIDKLVTQANDAVGQLDDVGASSAQVASVSKVSGAKFQWESSTFGDQVPTINVGFVTHAKITADNGGEDAGGLTSPMYMSDTCVPTVTIEFPAESATDWSLSSPSELKLNYWSVGSTAPDDSDAPGTWFRPSFLHEMLHAFGMHHTKTAYAMMDHRGSGFPWGNRADADAVRPLPDDVRWLRSNYPSSGTRWDVDASNSWYRYTDTSKGGAADQAKLCTPSVGTSLAQPQVDSGPCGTGGPNAGETCARPGETIATRYALNNYSTGSVRVTSELSFSADATWEGTDEQSSTLRTDDVGETSSKLVEATWTVPGETGSKLHPIVHLFSEHVNADGSIDPSSFRTAWIPLRGTIDISRYCS